MRRSSFVLAALAASLAAAPAGAQTAQARTHLGGKASSLVSLIGSAAPGETNALLVQNTDGSTGGPFELPAGTALVVTDLVATVNGASVGRSRGGLVNAAAVAAANPYFSFTTPAETHHSIPMTGGALWTVAPSILNAPDSANPVFVNVHGYLVKNR